MKLKAADMGVPFSFEDQEWKQGESRQGKAREHKKRIRMQSEQDERVDKLSLSLASAERPPPCTAHLMYLKAWQYGFVCSGLGGGSRFVFLRLLSPSKYHYRHPMIESDKQKQPYLKTATLN